MNIIIIWTMYNIYEIFYLIAVYKPEAANSLDLLMMSGVPLETC
jgi:hypothetical protein